MSDAQIDSIRPLGRSGLMVSEVGLGTNNLGLKLNFEESREVVHAALDFGVTLFDTSDSYGDSEERLGALLANHRQDVIIATKFGDDVTLRGQDNGRDWGARGSRRYIRRAVENSLRRLRTDWIDLYQMHRPDPNTPIEETLSVLDDLVREGKIRYIGHSNFSGWEIADAEWIARTRNFERFISAQNEYSLLARRVEAEVVPAITEFGIGMLPYFPLASGLLTGKYRRGDPVIPGSRVDVWKMESILTPSAFDVIERLDAFATAHETSLLSVAMGWIASRPGVASVLVGATSAEQMRANIDAAKWRPSEAEVLEIDAITRPGL